MFDIYVQGVGVVQTTLAVWSQVDFRLTWAPDLKLKASDCLPKSFPTVYDVGQVNSMLRTALEVK